MEMNQNKRNKVLIIICVIFGILLITLGGYIVYNKFIVNNGTEAYIGKFMAIDGDPNDSYIELYSNNKYKRNNNFCSETVIFEGIYSVSEENGITIITFTSETDEYGHDVDTLDPLLSFKFANNKLSLINETNEYGYYDCSNVRTFEKQ